MILQSLTLGVMFTVLFMGMIVGFATIGFKCQLSLPWTIVGMMGTASVMMTVAFIALARAYP